MKKLLIILIFAASTAHGEIYTWTDSRGAAHYTNRMDEIPVRYRAKAKPLNYGDGPQSGASSSPRSDQPQSAKPAEQATVPTPAVNLERQSAPPQLGSRKPEELKRQQEERREMMKAKRRKALGQKEE